MEGKIRCSLIGCEAKATEKHHVWRPTSLRIWVCAKHHGELHGAEGWDKRHSSLIRAGLAKARAAGRVGGNPKMRNPEFTRAMGEARKARAVARLAEGADEWLPLVVQARRAGKTWQQTTDILNASQPEDIERWSWGKLRTTVTRLVDAGMADRALLKRVKQTCFPPRSPATTAAIPIVADLMKSNPGITLLRIAKHLETLGMRPSRGKGTWGPSSVMAMRDQAIASGLIDLRDTVRGDLFFTEGKS